MKQPVLRLRYHAFRHPDKDCPLTNLQQIISDLERQKAAIEDALAALRGLSADAPQRRGPGRPPQKRSNLSEEGRQRIAAAQRERWATKNAAGRKVVSKTVGTTGSKTKAVTKKAAARKRSAPKKAAAKKSAPASQTAS